MGVKDIEVAQESTQNNQTIFYSMLSAIKPSDGLTGKIQTYVRKLDPCLAVPLLIYLLLEPNHQTYFQALVPASQEHPLQQPPPNP